MLQIDLDVAREIVTRVPDEQQHVVDTTFGRHAVKNAAIHVVVRIHERY